MPEDYFRASDLARAYNRMSFDALHLSAMSRAHIRNIATGDRDFERVDGIVVWSRKRPSTGSDTCRSGGPSPPAGARIWGEQEGHEAEEAQCEGMGWRRSNIGGGSWRSCISLLICGIETPSLIVTYIKY
jgi:hypothetical protein